MIRPTVAMLASLGCLAALSGCGDSPVSRGTTGAAIGVGAGAVICAATIIGIVPCAVAGGALGAAGGVSTAGPDTPPPPVAATAAPTTAPYSPYAPEADEPAPTEPVAPPPPPSRVTAEPLQ